MNVLVLNVGSASLKFEVITAAENPTLDQLQKQVKGSIEGIGSEAVLSQLNGQEVIHQQKITAKDYEQATQEALKWLGDRQQSESAAKFDIIGHRVVHGADSFTGATLIDEQVIADIEALEELAPLHNAPAVSTIRATRNVLGSDIPMVAVFDTVFHHNIPEHAKLYAIPKELSERHRIRRYGFHGISHQYMMMRYAQMTARSSEEINIITMHLESGCSATAINTNSRKS